MASEVEGIVRKGSAGAAPVVVGTGEAWFAEAEAIYTDSANIFLVIPGAIVALAGLAVVRQLEGTSSGALRQLEGTRLAPVARDHL